MVLGGRHPLAVFVREHLCGVGIERRVRAAGAQGLAAGAARVPHRGPAAEDISVSILPDRGLNGTKEESRSRPFALMAPKQPSLPTNWAFVVQLHACARVEKDEFTDWVEHLVSGRSTHFASLEALGAFITRVLRAQSARDGGHRSA